MVPRLALAVIAFLSVSACAAGADRPAYRSLLITDGKFDRREIVVSSHSSVELQIRAIGPAVRISIPGLGVDSETAPANLINIHSVHGYSLADLKPLRVRLRDVEAGQYQIVCDCNGRAETANFVVLK